MNKLQENAINIVYFKGQLDSYNKFKIICSMNINTCRITDKECTFKNCPQNDYNDS